MTVVASRLWKAYGGIPVLRGIDLQVANGEIHALLGANGAGKSTLIKCLSGAVTPDSGVITFDQASYRTGLTPRIARELGVSVIYQDFSLAPTLSVAENIFLGEELTSGIFVRKGAQEREAANLLRRLGAFGVSPSAKVESLYGAGPQLVEIAKALRRRASLLVLDEPTAALTERESQLLAARLKGLKGEGLAILYITHRIDEVFETADTVTVLRDGRVVLNADVSGLGRKELVSAIVGKPNTTEKDAVSARRSRPRPARCLPSSGNVILKASSLLSTGIGPIDFEIREGEIVGIYGLLGSGRTELLEALACARPIDDGVLRMNGRAVTFRRPADAIAAGIALVPSERLKKSIFAPLSALENVLLPSLRRLSTGPLRGHRRELRAFRESADGLNLQPPNGRLPARFLSGGNQQKLAIGRWTRHQERLRVLLLDEPTQGVDIGAREELYQLLRNGASQGLAIAVTSSEPEELLRLTDRVVVLSRGRSVGEVSTEGLAIGDMVSLAHRGEGDGFARTPNGAEKARSQS